MSSGKRLSPELAPGETPSLAYIADKLAPYKSAIGPLPFFLFVTEALLALICQRIYGDTDLMLKLAFGQLLAINTTMAGLLHFFPPMLDFYTSMVFLPFKHFWVYASGVALLAGGLGIAFSQTQVRAAWCLIATFVAIFPGNIACVVMDHPRKVVCGGSIVMALVRLPFQFLFIAWAWWFTSPPSTIPV